MAKGNLEHDAATNSAPGGALIRSILERVERMNEEKKAISEDIKEIYAEAKGNGLNVKTLRKMVQRRAMDKAKRDEEDILLHLYSKAVGDSSPADAEDDE
jgi:uncharacterized protein (UPF0335 family)